SRRRSCSSPCEAIAAAEARGIWNRTRRSLQSEKAGGRLTGEAFVQSQTSMSDPTLSSFGTQREGASRYVGALREHWLLILMLVIVAVGSAAAYSYTAKKKFKADADVLVTPQGSDIYPGLPVIRDTNGLTSGVLTAARLIQTPQVADRVRARHPEFGLSRDGLLGSISVDPLSQSNVIAIVSTARSADRAANIANAFANEFTSLRAQQFNSALDQARSRLRAQVNSLPASQQNSPAASDLRAQLASLETAAGGPDPSIGVASNAVPPSSQSWPR